MKIKTQHAISSNVKLPTSKSFINRVLILASLVPEKVKLSGVSSGSDVDELIFLLQKIGLDIECQGGEITVYNSFPACEKKVADIVVLPSGEGGTTNRFLLPLLALGKNRYQLQPKSSLLSRPMDEMWECLQACRVKVEKQDSRWPIIQGPLKFPKCLRVDTSRTTQVASAFTHLKVLSEFSLDITDAQCSHNYLRMSEELVRRFKKGERTFFAPLDFSAVGYLLAQGVHIAPTVISGLVALDPLQPDSILMKLIRQWGVKVGFRCSGAVVHPTPISGFTLDCRGFPDLVPTLAFLAAYAQGESRLQGIKNLMYKESNRLKELEKILKLFNVKFSYCGGEDELIISGGEASAPSVKYRAPHDHRMAIVALLFMLKNAGGEIENFGCVQKSFPGLMASAAITPLTL